MSETKYTPGPWSWHGDELLSATEFVLGTNRGSRPTEVNARLIAAAPSLLAALDCCPDPADFADAEKYREGVNNWWDYVALPAIEKAKGLRS